MANGVIISSNHLVALVWNEKFEKTPIDVNVFQWLHEEEIIGKVVHIQMTQSIWDHQMSPTFHALAIYLKLIHTFRNRLEKFDECQCEDDDICLFL
jgi:hypothetical protein